MPIALGIVSSAYMATAPPFVPGTGPVYIQGKTAALSAQVSPAVTFDTPVQTNDVIYFYLSHGTATLNISTLSPASWINVLGGTNKVASTANECFGIYRVVTSGENGTSTFSVTGFSAGLTGTLLAIVLRNVYLTEPIDNFGSTLNSTVVTPHVLAAITGTSNALYDKSLVIRGVSKDGVGTYTTPAGHTQRLTLNSTCGTWLGTLDALTTANTDVTATNITPNASDEYTSLSVAFTSAPSTGLQSVRFDNSADSYTCATTALVTTSFTMACWVSLTTDLNVPSYFLGADKPPGDWNSLGTFSDGVTMRYTQNLMGDATGGTFIVGDWYYVALVYNSAGADNLYYAAAGSSTLTPVSITTNPIVSASTFWIGNNGFTQRWDGRVAQVRVWSAALSQAELEAEKPSKTLVRTSNIWGFWSFSNGPQTNDESGQGRTLTAAGTLTSEGGPPI